MPVLIGPEGVSGELDTRFVRSVSAARRAFADGLPSVTTAGPHGALDLYRDDEGVWRGNVYQYLRTVERNVFPSREAGLRWLGAALPKLGDLDTMAGPTAPEWEPVAQERPRPKSSVSRTPSCASPVASPE